MLIALKFAEFKYLYNKNKETPIILFDDIFSELDLKRVEKVIELLKDSDAQIFITLTEPNIIPNNDITTKKIIKIENGVVLPEIIS
ncbi:DNA replication and repair protein RecF [bioreactor metagenome]|uniref:DNA replication and repair protein RecF n=1 Tax=bioreactor metagenome TaxID=1076179 RepID=A0A645JGQ9_9ZZZZ